jgi:prenylcysteine alpha-carboxyl methylesterase
MQPTTPVSGRAGAEAEAFLHRSGGGGTPRLRRRDSSAPSTPSARGGVVGGRRPTTFREDVGHAAAETYLVTRLAFILLRYLG